MWAHGYAREHPGPRIRVNPDDLVTMSGRLQAVARELRGLQGHVLALARALEVEIRQQGHLQAQVEQALAMLHAHLQATEAMARFLVQKAQAFADADQAAFSGVASLTTVAAAAVQPLPPATGLWAPGAMLGSYLRCGSLIAPEASAAAEQVSAPAWVVRVGGALKMTAGWMGAVGGLALATGLVASGLGLVALPVLTVAWLHAAAGVSTGALELALGEEQENPLLPWYNRIFGEERGDAVYQAVDVGLFLVGATTLVRRALTTGVTLVATRVAARAGAAAAGRSAARAAARQALGKLTREGVEFGVDLADRHDLVKRLYKRTGGSPAPAKG